VRVGLACAKGLAYALERRIMGVISLDVMVEEISTWECENLIPLIDAKWGELYYAIYTRKKTCWKRISDYKVATLEELLKEAPPQAIVFGDALKRYKDKFRNLRPLEREVYPKASSVARLASKAQKGGKSCELASLLPLYLRPSEAEFKRIHTL
jgi:tRNA threonylcarbamoyl adenosine modification protein YeaZ